MGPTGKTKDRGWQAGARRTVAVSPRAAWAFLTSPTGMQTWLGARSSASPLAVGTAFDSRGVSYRIVSLRKEALLRLRRGTARSEGTERDDVNRKETTVQLRLIQAAGGTTISLHIEGLQSADERTSTLAELKTALSAIEASLSRLLFQQPVSGE